MVQSLTNVAYASHDPIKNGLDDNAQVSMDQDVVLNGYVSDMNQKENNSSHSLFVC